MTTRADDDFHLFTCSADNGLHVRRHVKASHLSHIDFVSILTLTYKLDSKALLRGDWPILTQLHSY